MHTFPEISEKIYKKVKYTSISHVYCISSGNYATRRKIAGSSPDEVIGFFSIDLTLSATLWPSNRNEYQEYSWG
jgi:hypothetical protein